MPSDSHYARIAIAGPFTRTFVYHSPEKIEHISSGHRVLVPFGKRTRAGFYLGPADCPPNVTARPIISLLDESSLFSPELYNLCLWVADYYFANPADCLAAALPSSLKSNKPSRLIWGENCQLSIGTFRGSRQKPGQRVSGPEMVALRQSTGASIGKLLQEKLIAEEFPVDSTTVKKALAGYRLNGNGETEQFIATRRAPLKRFEDVKTKDEIREFGWTDYLIRSALKAKVLEPIYKEAPDDILSFLPARQDVKELLPTSEQQQVIDDLSRTLDGGFLVHLLHGVTGSGKTLVYTELAKKILSDGKTLLLLTPEIHLSGSVLSYFRGIFPDQVTVMHSAMTPRERLASWNGIRSGRYPIVIGPRSAVFAPLENIGLIIVDEEHDGSYKQDDPSPRFNGRDVAIMRAKNNDIPILLGSASPSVDSYYKAKNGQYRFHELRDRPVDMSLPEVTIVNMSKDRLGGDLPFLSSALKRETTSRLEAGDQVILFLNRRGYSPQVKCSDCGHVPHCKQCDVSLTYHRSNGRMICHYCDFQIAHYEICASCRGTDLFFPGAGTQRVEEALPRLFEKAKAVRFDSDTASGRTRAYQILHEFGQGRYNLLLGTQMVTKGLDLGGVTLVGVLSADLGLDLPDFRASEKTFARLLQVAGRAGRSGKRGKVLIQTYYPESSVILHAAAQDYGSFYDDEIESRRTHNYPPFVRLVNFILSSTDQRALLKADKKFRTNLSNRLKSAGLAADILGPAPCPRVLLKGSYRRHLLVKTNSLLKLLRLLADWNGEKDGFGMESGVRVIVDVDPNNMM